MYGNKIISASQLSVNSERPGIVGTAVKFGTGSATGEASGNYSGTIDLQYIVEIDSIALGAEIGDATFRWKNGLLAGWNAGGVTTTSTPIELDNGVHMRWNAGSGNDFAVGDEWRIIVTKKYGRGKLIDLDRNTEYRTDGLSATADWIVADLGAPYDIKCFILMDHNISATASYAGVWGKLQASASNNFTTPDYQLTVTSPGTLPIVAFLNETYRYWRFITCDPTNTTGFLRFSEMYLGDYSSYNWLQPIMPSYKIIKWIERSTKTLSGIERIQASAKSNDWVLRISYVDNIDSIVTMFNSTRDFSNQITRPLFFTPRSTVPSDTYLIFLGDTLPVRIFVGDEKEVEIECIEQVRAYV
jgi:hypothetical protein